MHAPTHAQCTHAHTALTQHKERYCRWFQYRSISQCPSFSSVTWERPVSDKWWWIFEVNAATMPFVVDNSAIRKWRCVFQLGYDSTSLRFPVIWILTTPDWFSNRIIWWRPHQPQKNRVSNGRIVDGNNRMNRKQDHCLSDPRSWSNYHTVARW